MEEYSRRNFFQKIAIIIIRAFPDFKDNDFLKANGLSIGELIKHLQSVFV